MSFSVEYHHGKSHYKMVGTLAVVCSAAQANKLDIDKLNTTRWPPLISINRN